MERKKMNAIIEWVQDALGTSRRVAQILFWTLAGDILGGFVLLLIDWQETAGVILILSGFAAVIVSLMLKDQHKNADDRRKSMITALRDGAIWVMIIGFAFLYLPDDYLIGTVLAILVGFGLVLLITIKLGDQTDKPWRHARLAIRVAIVCAVLVLTFTGIINAIINWWPEFGVGSSTAVAVGREELAVSWFGQEYDQIKLTVVTEDVAHILGKNGKPVRSVCIFPNEKYWRLPGRKPMLMDDNRRYFVCHPARPLFSNAPDPGRLILIPRSAVKQI